MKRLIFLVVTTVIGLLVCLVGPAAAADRVAFVTSVTGNGNLGLWADAGGNNGLAAADAICQARAMAGGLTAPGDFVAWMSDATNDAYCRVHGLTGTRAGNCGGQPILPDDAGPWVRTDGYPFAPKVGDALGASGIIYGPAMLDEYGNPGPHSVVFTETDQNGVYISSASSACAGWTSAAAEQVMAGDNTAGTTAWTSSGMTLCSSVIPILCMQTGAGDPLPPHWRQGATVFVTSVSGTGDLSQWPDAGLLPGITGANAVCQARATAAGLPAPTSYRAWLSDSTHDATDQITLDGPWVRVDGVPVASTLADLVDGQLAAAINVTETGAYEGNIGVWTGTGDDGLATANLCSDWGDGTSSSTGTKGSAYRSSSWWTEFGSGSACPSNYRIYCISNTVATILLDGFESADTAAWSGTLP